MPLFIAFDCGATKTAWATFNQYGELEQSGRYPTPAEAKPFCDKMAEIVRIHKVDAVGIGIAGTIRDDHRGPKVCGNIPGLNDLDLAAALFDCCGTLVTVENDARVALIGEVWKGSAQDMSSAVLLTVGTGIGGAVMQKGKILAHPTDITKEISRILVDPSDVFPATSGSGSVEAFIGGRNLENRLDIDLHTQADLVRKNDPEAIALWRHISELFSMAIRAVHDEYSCKNIIIGGVGAKDLEYYLQDTPPCPVIPAQLGEQAALYGAARLAIDLYEADRAEWE